MIVKRETRSHSPVRPPDQPYNEVMIQASPVKKKEKLTKITIDKSRSFKDRLKSASNLDLLFRPSPHAQAGTFDSVKKKATFLKKVLLVSLFDDSNFSCIQQNRDIWASKQFLNMNAVLFFQIRAESEEGKKLFKFTKSHCILLMQYFKALHSINFILDKLKIGHMQF